MHRAKLRSARAVHVILAMHSKQETRLYRHILSPGIRTLNQGTLNKGEGSVQVTSSLR